MAKGRGLVSFAAGFGSGYLDGEEMKRKRGIEDEERAERQADRARRREAEDREARDRVTLARAMKPATVNEGAVTMDMGDGAKVYDMPEAADVAASDSRQAVRLGMAQPTQQQTVAVNGAAYPNLESARTAADAYNAPEAVAQRVRGADVSDPSKAITLSQSLVKQGREDTKWTQEQAAYAKKLADEGAFDTAKALRTGDPAAIVSAFNRGGEWKIEGEPQIKPAERDLPGFGKVKTYDVTVNLRGKDGQQVTKTVNSHDFSMSILPYEKSLELQRKGVESDSKQQLRLDQMENAAKRLELQGMVAEARVLRAQASGNSQSARDKQQARLTYTTLFRDSGERMTQAQKALAALQKDPDFNRRLRKSGDQGPEAQQVQELRSEIARHSQDREMYQGFLAETQGDGKKPAGEGKPEKPAKAAGEPVKVTTKAERDKLPKGARYIGPDGQTYVKQ
jgi:hypothetical protein